MFKNLVSISLATGHKGHTILKEHDVEQDVWYKIQLFLLRIIIDVLVRSLIGGHRVAHTCTKYCPVQLNSHRWPDTSEHEASTGRIEYLLNPNWWLWTRRISINVLQSS